MDPVAPTDDVRHGVRRVGVIAATAVAVVVVLGGVAAFVHQAVQPGSDRPPAPYRLVVSSSPCGTVGYVVPRDHQGRSGQIDGPGSLYVMQKLPEAWLRSRHVYGWIVAFAGPPPPKAVGFFQSGSRTVMVGQVTNSPNSSCGHS